MFKRSVILCVVFFIAPAELAEAQSYLFNPATGRREPVGSGPTSSSRKSAVAQLNLLKNEGAAIGDVGHLYNFTIIQVIDENNAIAQTPDDRPNSHKIYTYWMKIATEGMVDGSRLDSEKRLFTITGTKQYETTSGGSKTLFVLEPEKATVPKKEFTPRIWTDSSNKHTLRATFVELTSNKVKLRKDDGSFVTIEINGLSAYDQRWLRSEAPTTTAAEKEASPTAEKKVSPKEFDARVGDAFEILSDDVIAATSVKDNEKLLGSLSNKSIRLDQTIDPMTKDGTLKYLPKGTVVVVTKIVPNSLLSVHAECRVLTDGKPADANVYILPDFFTDGDMRPMTH
jgi:hypothetical protein